MVGAPATDSITNAPDLSANGHNDMPILAPWSNVGFTTSALETALGVRTPCAWHKFYVPVAGPAAVSDYPPQFSDPHVPDAGDTYLHVFWSATGAVTDASPASALTLIGANDDSAGGSKGYLSWTDPGGRWIYVCHEPYSGSATFSNQWTYIDAPYTPTLRMTALGGSSVTANISGGVIPLGVVALGTSSVAVYRRIALASRASAETPDEAVSIVGAFAGHAASLRPAKSWGQASLEPALAAAGVGPTPPPTTGQIWPRGKP